MTDPYSAYPPAPGVPQADPGLPPGPPAAEPAQPPAAAPGLAVRFYRYTDPAGRGQHQAVLVVGQDGDGADRGYVLGHVDAAARFPAGTLTEAPDYQEGDR